MLARTETVASVAQNWLAQFERALADADGARLETLFHPDGYWRDVLALTWRIATLHGPERIVEGLQAHSPRTRPFGFCVAAHRTAPRQVTRAGTSAIEVFFSFETAAGRGSGIVRLVDAGGPTKAWTLLTALDELKGLPPALVIVDENDVIRDQGEAYATKLREADVPTVSVRFNGTMHDFMMLAVLRDSETTHAAMSLAASTFRRAFGTDHS